VPSQCHAPGKPVGGDVRETAVVARSYCSHPFSACRVATTQSYHLTHATGREGTKSFSAAYPSSGHARDRRGGSLGFSWRFATSSP
jgi:hypothetical protein